MRITIFLFTVGICLVSAKYLSYETNESNALLRTKRSDDSSEQDEISNESDNDNSDDDHEVGDQQKLEDKLKRKALKQQEKEEKAQRKEEEKREKEARKRLERLEKQLRKEEEKQRKELEKTQKQERKRQEKQRKELEKLEKETLQGGSVDNDYLETEEENSVELSDVWKEYVYVKYGLNLASTKLEKQAALNRYLQEQLGINQNSTKSERFQAVIQFIQTKLANDVSARTAFKSQLLSHTNAVSIQKLRAGLEKDIEELNNKTEILNNITLPWVPLAKQQIEEKRSFLQTIHQFLLSILPTWLTGGQNTQNLNDVTGNGPVTVPNNDGDGLNGSNVISESNIASGGNVVIGYQGIGVTADQSNTVVSTGTNNLSTNAESNSLAAGSGTVFTNGNGNKAENNNNENKTPITSIIGSEDSNGSVGSNGNNIIINSETPSSVNSGPTLNSDSIASNNVINNTPTADAVPQENTDTVLSISNNNELTHIPDPVVNLSVSSNNVNVDGVTSTHVINDAPPSNTNDISSTNNEPTNVENSAAVESNLSNPPPSLINVANPLSSSIEPQTPGASEVDPENGGNIVYGSSSDGTSPVKPGIVSDNSINSPTINVGDNVPSTVPELNSEVTISNGVNPTNAGNVASITISSSQDNGVTSNNEANEISLGTNDGTVDANVDIVPAGDGETTSGNDANVLFTNNNDKLPSVTPDTTSSTNIDVSMTNRDNVLSNAPDSTIVSAVDTSEGINSPTYNNDVAVTPDVQQNTNSDATTSNMNTEIVNPDIISAGSSDTTSINNIINPSSSLGDVIPPNPSVVTSKGNEVDSNTNVASTSETDIVSSGAPSASVDVISSSVVTDSSSLPNNDPNEKFPENNVDVVAENASPVVGVISKGETVSSVVSLNGIDSVNVTPINNVISENVSPVAGDVSNDSEAVSAVVSPSGIDNVNVAPINNENIGSELGPSEGTDLTPSITPNDSTTENNKDVNAPEVIADLPISDSNVNVDSNNIHATIATEVINTIQAIDGIGSTAPNAPIVTESPIDNGKAIEQLTTINDLIGNVNTVVETSAPSEAPQSQTSESSLVDTVSPVELPGPLVTSGVTIPAEPGTSVVEVIPQ